MGIISGLPQNMGFGVMGLKTVFRLSQNMGFWRYGIENSFSFITEYGGLAM